MVLEERGRKVLEAVVSSYIETGEPVGSRTITKKYGFGLSPATIRNIMADLEDLQFLTHPHTSAGRIPTDLGYRYYVDVILESASNADIEGEIRDRFSVRDADTKSLLAETSRLLSSLTHHAGLVMAAAIPESLIRRVQFIRLSSDKVLVIMITSVGMVQNKFIDMSEDLSQKSLDELGSRLNLLLDTMSLRDVRENLYEEMRGTRESYTRMLEQMFSAEAGQAERRDNLYVGGVAEIFSRPEFTNNIERLKSLYHAFEEKYHLIRLLDSSLSADGVQIFIGAENPYFEMHECSVVTANYSSQERVVGVLGVIGPKRMDYSRVIPVVNCTAKILGKMMDRTGDIKVR